MRRNLYRALFLVIAAAALAAILPVATTQTTTTQCPRWLASAWQQALSTPLLPVILSGGTPATIPQTMSFPDPTGKISSYRSDGTVTTANNAFFSSLGTNNRTCLTCHQPQNGWSISPDSVMATYKLTQGRDPLFAPVDGADCPDSGAAATKYNSAFIAARKQLFTHGNFRIFLPVPPTREWQPVTIARDPGGCECSKKYGLPAGMLSFYRRPLPAANVTFVGPGAVILTDGTPGVNIMWDTREPSLASQFLDATLVHAQASASQAAALQTTTMGALQINQGVTFQQANYTAQSYDTVAGDLTGMTDASGALGGPQNLFNFTLSLPPPGPGFGTGNCFVGVGSGMPCPGSFALNFANGGTNVGSQVYASFGTTTGTTPSAKMRQSIARGEALYNGTDPQHHGVFIIDGVSGLVELGAVGPPNVAIPNGTCTTCHNNVNVGNDDFLDPKHLGIGDNSYVSARQKGANGSSTLLPSSDRPLFTFLCPPGSIPFFSNPVVVNGVTYDKFQTTDPGVGWITGKCADLGKFKVPVLRGLASRAPFFHGGEAATMKDVILFYKNRFNMNLTNQDVQDLINFMNSL
ncbi:MAG TPA: hypothetical protein VLV49_00210 [Terriglobales bacterium]|nr:hypothetical protein [Terriglobales bacterium]